MGSVRKFGKRWLNKSRFIVWCGAMGWDEDGMLMCACDLLLIDSLLRDHSNC